MSACFWLPGFSQENCKQSLSNFCCFFPWCEPPGLPVWEEFRADLHGRQLEASPWITRLGIDFFVIVAILVLVQNIWIHIAHPPDSQAWSDLRWTAVGRPRGPPVSLKFLNPWEGFHTVSPYEMLYDVLMKHGNRTRNLIFFFLSWSWLFYSSSFSWLYFLLVTYGTMCQVLYSREGTFS